MYIHMYTTWGIPSFLHEQTFRIGESGESEDIYLTSKSYKIKNFERMYLVKLLFAFNKLKPVA